VTLLIHSIEQKAELRLIIWLINNGASFLEPDSEG